MTDTKLFISYCWSSTEHEEWVLRLSTELRENGVNVIFDKWDLKEGNNANVFMEKMVSDTEIQKVILIIDDQYSEKANRRTGGVGTETQIISAEVYESVDQSKFVAVIAERDEKGEAKLPVFYKSRIYIDLSDEALYGKNFEQLLRWIYDKPLHVKPELGKKPEFLNNEIGVAIGTSTAFRRLVDAFKNSKPYSHGALIQYFDLFAGNLEKFRLEPSKGVADFDVKVLESIKQFIPARNELIEVFSTIAQYDSSRTIAPAIHKFFELLIPYLDRPNGTNSYHKWDFDNFKFIVQECFILCVAIFLKHQRFDIVEHLLKQRYYTGEDQNQGESTISSFVIFVIRLRSFEQRDQRLQLRRLSLHADLIKERCTDSGISFNHIMQADFVLYLAGALRRLKEEESHIWHPESLLFRTFHGGAFEIFLRSESTEYFSQIAPMFDLKSKSELEEYVEAVKSGGTYIPKWDYEKISPLKLMNYEKLCSRV